MGPKCARTVPLLMLRQLAVQRLHVTHTYRLLTRANYRFRTAARVGLIRRVAHESTCRESDKRCGVRLGKGVGGT